MAKKMSYDNRGKRYNKYEMKEVYGKGMKRIFEKHHPKMRSSDEACNILADALREKGKEIADRAAELARYAKRKTIKKADIELAIQELL